MKTREMALRSSMFVIFGLLVFGGPLLGPAAVSHAEESEADRDYDALLRDPDLFPSLRSIGSANAADLPAMQRAYLSVLLRDERMSSLFDWAVPSDTALLSSMLTGRKRLYAFYAPVLITLLEATWDAKTPGRGHQELAQIAAKRLVSELGAPRAILKEASSPPGDEVRAALDAWHRELAKDQTTFEAMVSELALDRRPGEPAFLPGLVGVPRPDGIESSDSKKSVEFGEGLRIEASAVEFGGRAALLRGWGLGTERWSLLLTDRVGKAFRTFDLETLKAKSLGPLGWRLCLQVGNQPLSLYLTPEGAFRFYHACFRGSAEEGQRLHIEALVANGDVDGLRRLFKSGADPSAQSEEGVTLLHHAAGHGQPEVVRLLLARGVRADAATEAGHTALHFAAGSTVPRAKAVSKGSGSKSLVSKGSGHVEVARLLLDAGVSVNARTTNGDTPLHDAAMAGLVPMARLLIQRGADVNAVAAFLGLTPLHTAMWGIKASREPEWSSEDADFPGMVRLLLKHGADITARDSVGESVLENAADAGGLDVVDTLLEAGAADADPKELGRAMAQACSEGHLDVMARLVAAGASPTEAVGGKQTPLHHAVFGRNVDALVFLLERGADVNARDAGGETPLHYAAGLARFEAVQVLVKHGGDVEARSSAGHTLLHEAAASCTASRQLLEFLVGLGLDINAKTKRGHTPLQIALKRDCFMGSDVPYFLKQLGGEKNAGAPPDLREKLVLIPFDSARWIASGASKSWEEIEAVRVPMAKAACVVAMKRTQEEVHELLGNPHEHGENRWSFIIGVCRSMLGIPYLWLHLDFEDGKVVKADWQCPMRYVGSRLPIQLLEEKKAGKQEQGEDRDAATKRRVVASLLRTASKFSSGTGVKQDYGKALLLYRKAADLGDAVAMRSIGHMYDRGQGVKQDYGEALRWYRKAAKLGDAGAMRNIASMYRKGQGVKQDGGEALRWYRKAADLGDAGAMRSIGFQYANGQGVKQDHGEALRWFRESARLDPGGDYVAMRIWLCLGLLSKPRDARVFLLGYRSKHTPKGWSSSILDFMAGDTSATALLEQAKSDDAKTQNERLCEAHFYIGSERLIAGETGPAAHHFRKCLATGLATFSEYKSAQAELKRMQAK